MPFRSMGYCRLHHLRCVQQNFSNGHLISTANPWHTYPIWYVEQVVEEFMSIADGQTVLRHTGGSDTEGVSVDARLSVSRIGSRAFPPALEALAPQIR